MPQIHLANHSSGKLVIGSFEIYVTCQCFTLFTCHKWHTQMEVIGYVFISDFIFQQTF